MGLFEIMSELSDWYGSRNAAPAGADINFDKWVAAHRNWRRRLTSYIHGISDEEFDEAVVCRDDRCELGAWIHGDGDRLFGRLPVFGKLRDHHAAFHRCAGQVVHIYKTEGRAKATKALHVDFDLASLKVIENIEMLEREVNGVHA
jgi:methyl-accepting chemotaxis protein